MSITSCPPVPAGSLVGDLRAHPPDDVHELAERSIAIGNIDPFRSCASQDEILESDDQGRAVHRFDRVLAELFEQPTPQRHVIVDGYIATIVADD